MTPAAVMELAAQTKQHHLVSASTESHWLLSDERHGIFKLSRAHGLTEIMNLQQKLMLNMTRLKAIISKQQFKHALISLIPLPNHVSHESAAHPCCEHLSLLKKPLSFPQDLFHSSLTDMKHTCTQI